MPHPNDIALTVRGLRKALELSYWDLWFLLVAEDSFGGDLQELADELKAQTSGIGMNRYWRKEELYHAKDLLKRLDGAGVTTAAVAEALAAFDKKERRKAKQKVLDGNEPMRKNKSEAMIETPERKGWRFARRGYWDEFPVSPQKAAARILPVVECDDYDLDDSFDLAKALDVGRKKAEDTAKAGKTNEAVAAFRGLMTEAVETIARADDSYGSIGDSFQGIFAAYRKALVDADLFWQDPYLPDLLEFIIWEDYGLTWQQTYGWFRKPPAERADTAVEFLERRRRELLVDDLDYQAENALQLLAQVAAEQRRFDLFAELVNEIAGQHWEPVLMLARAAAKARKKDLATQVFEESIQRGRGHRDFLDTHFQAFKEGTWKWKPGERRAR